MKKYKIIVQKEAIEDLDQIYAFVCQESPARAGKILKSLKKKILSLATLPFRGSLVRVLDLESAVRFISHQGYLFFYTIESEKVYLLYILGRGQDWWNLLQLPK